MKISYTERRLLNLGDFNNKSVEITIEDNVDFQNETVESSFERLKKIVVNQLEKAFNDKEKITVVKKKKVEPLEANEDITKEYADVNSITHKEETPTENVIITKDYYNVNDTRTLFITMAKYDKEFGNIIKSKLAELNLKLEQCNQDQFKKLNEFASGILASNNLHYDIDNSTIIKNDNEWATL